MQDTNRNLIAVVAVLAIVACCCVALIAFGLVAGRVGGQVAADLGGIGLVSSSRTHSEQFAVGTPTQLVVDIQAGSIDVTVGEGDAISLEATVKAYGATAAVAQEALDQVRFDVSQSGSTVEVTSDWSQERTRRWRSPEVDVRIRVPRQTSVDLKLDAGEILVSGVEGLVHIDADVGRVMVRDVIVVDQLDIQTDVAEISFEGSLSEGREYRLSSDVGAIQLLLPADSQFLIDASSDVGAVNIDFDVVGQTSSDFVGKSVKGQVGQNPAASLILRSDVGTISVRRR